MSKYSDKPMKDDQDYRIFIEAIKNNPNVDWSRVKFQKHMRRRFALRNFLFGLFRRKK